MFLPLLDVVVAMTGDLNKILGTNFNEILVKRSKAATCSTDVLLSWDLANDRAGGPSRLYEGRESGTEGPAGWIAAWITHVLQIGFSRSRPLGECGEAADDEDGKWKVAVGQEDVQRSSHRVVSFLLGDVGRQCNQYICERALFDECGCRSRYHWATGLMCRASSMKQIMTGTMTAIMIPLLATWCEEDPDVDMVVGNATLNGGGGDVEPAVTVSVKYTENDITFEGVVVPDGLLSPAAGEFVVWGEVADVMGAGAPDNDSDADAAVEGSSRGVEGGVEGLTTTTSFAVLWIDDEIGECKTSALVGNGVGALFER
ncbi:hypothetical protein BXZ70DRAFT_1030785 [Cristinia sonorae]|uniref:Uncharacterized protein n=1 Tax=Cristinia sonorae TaxID=1940300 RepID=A0A8K0UNM4_9AGAR|nr:hypothetical protein BXZ70DRAFT_1030785 [Cristinia sonorae]